MRLLALSTGEETFLLETIYHRHTSDEKFLRKAVDKFGKRVVVGIDARDGFAAVKGWKDQTKIKVVDLALEMQELGVKTIIYTDIKRDGMLTGPNIKACKEIAQKVTMDVIASGGVTTLRDVANYDVIVALAPIYLDSVESERLLESGSREDLANHLRLLSTQIQSIALRRGLKVVRCSGDLVEFSRSAHQTVDGIAPAEPTVKIVRPMVVRQRHDGGQEVIVKAVVTEVEN